LSLPAVLAIRAWLNARLDLVGPDQPVALGFFTTQQRSPDSGAYGVVRRSSQPVASVVAEDQGVDTARLSIIVYGGTEESSEAAAVAVLSAIETLTGAPEPCGDTGISVLVHDNPSGPMTVEVPPTGGEIYANEVASDFLLAAL